MFFIPLRYFPSSWVLTPPLANRCEILQFFWMPSYGSSFHTNSCPAPLICVTYYPWQIEDRWIDRRLTNMNLLFPQLWYRLIFTSTCSLFSSSPTIQVQVTMNIYSTLTSTQNMENQSNVCEMQIWFLHSVPLSHYISFP